ncbi:MAG: Hint domain-containing protein [Pseudomonadota bacterium]
MLLNHDKAFADYTPATPVRLHPATDRSVASLAPDTWLETPQGWRPVTELGRGDLVRSFDGGFIALTRVAHDVEDSARRIVLPAGCLGAATELSVPEDQWVAVHHARAERLYGSPVVLVRASALVGYRGAHLAEAGGPLSQISCTEDELIYAQTGAMIYVPGEGDGSHFPQLSYGDTRALLMMIDSQGCGPDSAMLGDRWAA